MRKINAVWPSQLSAIRDGEHPDSAPAVAALIRAGLVQVSLAPAGLFALRTGFAPSDKELQLLDALERGRVRRGTSWEWDADGYMTKAPGAVLSRFLNLGLAHGAPAYDGCSATDEGRQLCIDLNARFGRGWISDAAH